MHTIPSQLLILHRVILHPLSNTFAIFHVCCILSSLVLATNSRRQAEQPSVYRAPSASTAQYCVNTTNYLKTEENGVFSIKPLISKNVDTAREEKVPASFNQARNSQRSICILMQIYTRRIAHLLKWVSFSHSLQN